MLLTIISLIMLTVICIYIVIYMFTGNIDKYGKTLSNKIYVDDNDINKLLLENDEIDKNNNSIISNNDETITYNNVINDKEIIDYNNEITNNDIKVINNNEEIIHNNDEIINNEKKIINDSIIINDNKTTNDDNYYKIWNQIENKNNNICIEILTNYYNQINEIIPNFPKIYQNIPKVPENKGKFASKGEAYTCMCMEELFQNYKFIKVRPNWLKNPKTNRNLELDG